jgi:hypothetical protein
MYFWKTDQLAEDIKDNKISEKSKMYYYLLTISIYNIIGYQYLSEFSGDMTTAIGEMLVTTLVLIFGTFITFKTNNSRGGSDYIARVIMLGLPISIKLIVFTLIFQIVLYEVVFYYWNYDILTDLFISVSAAIISILLFWRINEHLKFINNEVH